MTEAKPYCGHHYVRCTRCQKVLGCSPYDANCLLEHLRKEHPEISIVNLGTSSHRANNDSGGVNCDAGAVVASTAPPSAGSGSRGGGLSKSRASSIGVENDNACDPDLLRRLCKWERDDVDLVKILNEENSSQKKAQVLGDKSSGFSEGQVSNRDRSKTSRKCCKCRQRPKVADDDRARQRKSVQRKNDKPKLCSFKKSSISSRETSDKDTDTEILYTKHHRPDCKPKVCDTGPRNLLSPCALFEKSICCYVHGKGCIFCPECLCANEPITRTRAEVLSQNSRCAKCIFSYCPRCLTSIFMPKDNLEYLYCCVCNSFFGIYNPTTNCIRRNRQFLCRYQKSDTSPAQSPRRK